VWLIQLKKPVSTKLLHLAGSPESLVIGDADHQNKINISGILFEVKE
jgi:hypothetical protein